MRRLRTVGWVLMVVLVGACSSSSSTPQDAASPNDGNDVARSPDAAADHPFTAVDATIDALVDALVVSPGDAAKVDARSDGPACTTNPAAFFDGFETANDPLFAPTTGSNRVGGAPASLSTVQKHSGASSLAIHLDGSAIGAGKTAWAYAYAGAERLAPFTQPGRTVSLWLWLPASAVTNHAIVNIQLYLQTGAGWISDDLGPPLIPAPETWTQLSLQIPPTYFCAAYESEASLFELGVYVVYTDQALTPAWSDTIYVDDFAINDGATAALTP